MRDHVSCTLARAIAEEEYERAETLNQEMERWKHTVTTATAALTQLQTTLRADDGVKADATRDMLTTVASCNAALTRLKSRHVGEMTTYVSERTSVLEKEEDQLNADMDRVERALAHTKQDLEVVQTEQVSAILVAATSRF